MAQYKKANNNLINPDRFYSLVQAQQLCNIRSREYIVKYIKAGKLLAKQSGNPEKKNGLRYQIKGSWLIRFNNNHIRIGGHGKTLRKRNAEFKIAVDRIIEYCREFDITTLEELYEEAHPGKKNYDIMPSSKIDYDKIA